MSPTSSVPPEWWMDIWVKAGSIATAILTFFAVILKIDRKIEGMKAEVKSNKDAIREVLQLFHDSDGNPRFVTMIVCKSNTDKCSLHYNDKFANLGERVTVLAIEISELRKDMKTSQDETLQAILAELRKDK